MTLGLFFPYSAQTQGLIVRVAVSFLPEQSYQGRWFWSYHIRLENQGQQSLQLIDRHWLITDALGNQEEVEGPGVIGQQPVIMPGETYDYVSGCPLATASGAMEGSYLMRAEDGSNFHAKIPRFVLNEPVSTP
jgi:ApaG protein